MALPGFESEAKDIANEIPQQQPDAEQPPQQSRVQKLAEQRSAPKTKSGGKGGL